MDASVRESQESGAGGDYWSGLEGLRFQGPEKAGLRRALKARSKAEAEGPASGRRWSSERCLPFRVPSPLDAAIAETRSLHPRFPPPHERMHQKGRAPLKTIPGPARPIFSLIFYLTSPTKTSQSSPSAVPSPSVQSASAQYHTMPRPRAAYTAGPRSPE